MKRQSGFSLIELSISTVLIGGAVLFSMKFFTNSQKEVKRTTSIYQNTKLLSAVNESLRQMAVNTGSDKDQGICGLMQSEFTSGGLGQINYVIKGYSDTDDPFKSLWTNYFPKKDWEEFTGEECKSDYAFKKCYRPKASNVLVATKGEEENSFYFSIKPINFNKKVKEKGAFFEEIKHNGGTDPVAIDAKDLGLLLTTTVKFMDPTTKKDVFRNSNYVLWLGEYSCHKKLANGKTLVLSTSGIGSGGVKPNQDILFSTTQEPSNTLISNEGFLTTIYTEGRRLDGEHADRAETMTESNYIADNACVESLFRCSRRESDGNPRLWSNAIDMNMRIKYNQNNPYFKTNSLKVNPKITFVKDSSKSSGIVAEGVNYKANGEVVTKSGDNNDESWFSALNSPMTVQADISGNVGYEDESNKGICQTICNEDNEYNHSKNEADQYRPLVEYMLETLPKGLSKNPVIRGPKATGCVCCYAKQCKTIGTKITSWCSAQPTEPNDARIPECSVGDVERTQMLSAIDSFYMDMTTSPVYEKKGTIDADKCIYATKSSKKSVLSIGSAECNSSKNVLCFAAGKFQMAKDPITGKLITATHEDAAKVCYNLGKDSVVKAEVDERLTDQLVDDEKLVDLPLPPVSGDKYSFVNSARAGIFTAPDLSYQVEEVVEHIENNSVWIAMKSDSSGKVLASAPWSGNTGVSNAMYYNRSGKLVVEENPSIYDVVEKGAEDAVLLSNHQSSFGAIKASAIQNSDAEINALVLNCSKAKGGSGFSFKYELDSNSGLAAVGSNYFDDCYRQSDSENSSTANYSCSKKSDVIRNIGLKDSVASPNLKGCYVIGTYDIGQDPGAEDPKDYSLLCNSTNKSYLISSKSSLSVGMSFDSCSRNSSKNVTCKVAPKAVNLNVRKVFLTKNYKELENCSLEKKTPGKDAPYTDREKGYRALCYHPHSKRVSLLTDVTGEYLYFKNKGTAKNACESYGQMFISPRNNIEWTQNMLDLAPHDPFLPFANNEVFSLRDTLAWSGMSKSGSSWDFGHKLTVNSKQMFGNLVPAKNADPTHYICRNNSNGSYRFEALDSIKNKIKDHKKDYKDLKKSIEDFNDDLPPAGSPKVIPDFEPLVICKDFGSNYEQIKSSSFIDNMTLVQQLSFIDQLIEDEKYSSKYIFLLDDIVVEDD